MEGPRVKGAAARLPGLPGIIWAAVGMAAALPVVVRLQVLLQQRFPAADWLVWVAGMAGGALLGVVALVWGLRLPWKWSTRRLLPLSLVCVALLAVGGLWHFPPQNLKDGEVAAEWGRLHPTLRWGLWAVRAVDGGLVLSRSVFGEGPEVYVGSADGRDWESTELPAEVDFPVWIRDEHHRGVVQRVAAPGLGRGGAIRPVVPHTTVVDYEGRSFRFEDESEG